MNHLSERALGLYAIDPALTATRDAVHLESCADCRRALDAVRDFDAALREPETWIGLSDAAPPARNDELRAFALRSAEEDAAALALLDEFREPSAAARFVWVNVASRTEYRTGGVARLLCKWANTMCERDPLYALKLAEAATAISAALPDESYPRGTIPTVRGDALKAQANACLSLGRLPEALRAVTDAEAEYGRLPQENIGLTAVKYLRGAIHYEQDELDAAEQAAFDAASAATRMGAADAYVNARHLLGHVLFERREYAAAAEVYEELLRHGRATNADAWTARASLSAGGCYLELRRIADADRYLHEALRLFTRLGFRADITRTHWWIARLIFVQGNATEAIYRLRRCIEEFTRQEILTDAAIVAVDLAEILHAVGRLREIRKVLANVVQTFIDGGKLTSALTALAYLKDAAAAGTMTPRLTAHVREFVRRTDRQPNLLFVAPV